ncbi:MAG: glycosyltransferase family 4 protein [Rhizomicrobium sp.]|nr:glycosyltransferase family 4 protein [Rhizomicrobium sp.]
MTENNNDLGTAPQTDSAASQRRLRIAIVLARPYQTFQGGDGAYVDAVVRHLSNEGHDICGLTSSVMRGRLRPVANLIYAKFLRPGWRLRGTVALGSRRILVSPILMLQALYDFVKALREKRLAPSWLWQAEFGEVLWLNAQLQMFRPDVTIFCFESVAMIPQMRHTGASLALVGFLPNRGYEIGTPGVATVQSEESLPPGLREGLLAAGAVGLNNVNDHTWWQTNPNTHNRAIFVGMCPKPFVPVADSDEDVVLFVGNKTAPNIAGLGWFLEKVWPRILTQRPGTRLRVVGRVADWVKESYAGVELIGKVDDIGEEYRRAKLVVVSLTNGSAGVKTKLIEAVAHGRPFVATTVAIEPEHRDCLIGAGFVEDEPVGFAQSVVTLLTDDKIRQAKQIGAKVVYDALFSPAAAYSDLDHWMQSLAAKN